MKFDMNDFFLNIKQLLISTQLLFHLPFPFSTMDIGFGTVRTDCMAGEPARSGTGFPVGPRERAKVRPFGSHTFLGSR